MKLHRREPPQYSGSKILHIIPEMRKIKTVAVIGGGLAGLTAARTLGLRGISVKLYEANNQLGGCCATTRIGGYTFNDGALFLAFPGLLDHLFHRLELDRESHLPLKKITELQKTVLPDGTRVIFDESYGITVEGDGGDAATACSRDELGNFLRKWDPLLHSFADDLLLHPFSIPRFAARIWRHLPLLFGTAASCLKRDFSHEAVRAAMAGTLLYAGMPPDKLPAAALLGLAAMFRQGYFIPAGGMGRFPETLGQAAQALGTEIYLSTEVHQILVSHGRVCGVNLGEKGITEVDAVISTVSGMHTAMSLMDKRDVPLKMAQKARNATLSHKGFAVQLGLANRIETGSYANYVLPYLRDQHQLFTPQQQSLNWPIYMIPTIAVPELAPSGGSIVEVFPLIRQELRAEDWNEKRKEEVAAQSIESLQHIHALDIAEHRILSPREYQNHSRLYSGALYGLSPLASPTTLFNYRSPVRGLYQAGQTTWPGFGVASAGISGVMAAETLICDRMSKR